MAPEATQGLTLTDLRAEYAEPILDAATRDPQLDALLESISANHEHHAHELGLDTSPGHRIAAAFTELAAAI